jgi:large subunit ribosomal protein L15
VPSEDELSLTNLQPAQPRKARKRVGRGLGSGKGRYSGRGIKGQKSRAGSHTMRAGFEGGQMPIYMRLPKQRGPYSKDAMPVGPHRTSTVPVNLRDLERVFAAGDDVTLEALVDKGLIKNTKTDVKILGSGELTKKLAVTAHLFSASAREKIEKAGGTATALKEHTPKKHRRRRKAAPAAEAPEPEETTEETPTDEAPADEASTHPRLDTTEETSAEEAPPEEAPATHPRSDTTEDPTAEEEGT